VNGQWIEIDKCPRCKREHSCEYKGLINPSDEYTAWTMCPTTGQPILLMVKTTVDKIK
jgi:hypothetical protein